MACTHAVQGRQAGMAQLWSEGAGKQGGQVRSLPAAEAAPCLAAPYVACRAEAHLEEVSPAGRWADSRDASPWPSHPTCLAGFGQSPHKDVPSLVPCGKAVAMPPDPARSGGLASSLRATGLSGWCLLPILGLKGVSVVSPHHHCLVPARQGSVCTEVRAKTGT